VGEIFFALKGKQVFVKDRQKDELLLLAPTEYLK